jgi:hypothetical protein
LLEFSTCGVRVSDADGFLSRAVQIDAQNLTVRPELVIRILEEDGEDHRLRAGLGEVFASEAFAETTKDALLEPQSFGIGIGLAQIRGIVPLNVEIGGATLLALSR